ncbi:hypothetical protein PG999_011610 [Apiospora kogelbergensis]|uniref:Methyltransferase domain-containing protein n=1 Tax=Apiospora kogelbergensis TaxID=1337665 RepID=A0AAW0QFW8_9PEZI
MKPDSPLPYPDCWAGPEEYVESLLEFATSSAIFRTLCGGVHILDFFTSEPGLFQAIVPEEWQVFLLRTESMQLLDVLMRKDPDQLAEDERPPESLVQYIKDIRRFSLARDHVRREKPPNLTRQVAVGMKPKKVHEVSNFASYINGLADDFADISGDGITHFVDFGSGQNYLGRALASAPYNKHIVAVEGREHNIKGAKAYDMLAGLAEKEKVMRNKKLWHQRLNGKTDDQDMIKPLEIADEPAVDFRPTRDLEAVYTPEEGKGFIRYISGRLESGDLSDVVAQLEDAPSVNEQEAKICGSWLSLSTPVAIVGCCYNLMTEKLGPPTYKLPFMRPSLQPLNGRVIRESAKCDPHGFPMSERLCTYKETGVRLNITARMMACQAPQNWGAEDSDSFFSRHFYRAVLQKIFLDKGVIQKVYHDPESKPEEQTTPFNTSTNPIIIGSLRKACYKTLNTYIRGAIDKLTTHSDYREQCEVVSEKMGDMTDDEIASYEQQYRHRKRELSAIWSLMAFSAAVVESLIVTDRWLFLKQHTEMVDQCWVESVFDFKESPRNLVVVGIKKRDS